MQLSPTALGLSAQQLDFLMQFFEQDIVPVPQLNNASFYLRVSRLRAKLKKHGVHVKHIRSKGYAISPEDRLKLSDISKAAKEPVDA